LRRLGCAARPSFGALDLSFEFCDAFAAVINGFGRLGALTARSAADRL
jgi:hypothetical protein